MGQSNFSNPMAMQRPQILDQGFMLPQPQTQNPFVQIVQSFTSLISKLVDTIVGLATGQGTGGVSPEMMAGGAAAEVANPQMAGADGAPSAGGSQAAGGAGQAGSTDSGFSLDKALGIFKNVASIFLPGKGLTTILGKGGSILNIGKDLLGGLFGKGKDLFGGLLSKGKDLFGGLFSKGKDLLGGALNIGKSILGGIF